MERKIDKYISIIIRAHQQLILILMMIGLITLLLMAYQSLQTTNFYRLELQGNHSQGYYYVQLYFGHPLQLQTLVIDTGSSATAFPCSNCKYCDSERLASLYNSERSFTSSIIKCVKEKKSHADICINRCSNNKENCQISLSYMDGTTLVGDILDDQVSFTNDESEVFHAYFGCSQYQKEATGIKANGIMGLGPLPSQNILYKWFQASPQRSAEFTVCLGENGGFLQIGKSPDIPQYDSILKYEKTIQSYTLTGITSIKYGRLNIFDQSAYRRRGFVLDTGSTVSYLPQAIYAKVVTLNEQLCSRNKNCMAIQDLQASGCLLYTFTQSSEQERLREFDKNFPTFTLETEEGQKHSWYPRNQFKILNQVQDNLYVICMTVYPSGGSGEGDMYLMGDSFLREKKITFNIKQQTISIVDNQTCVYQPYLPSLEHSFFKKLLVSTANFINQNIFQIGLAIVVIVIIIRKQIGAFISRVTNRFDKKRPSKELNQEHLGNQQNQVSIVQTSVNNNLEISQKSEIQVVEINNSEA